MAVAVASTIGGAIANTLAFNVSQVAARALGGDGGSLEEVKLHNAALKQLQEAPAEYNQKRTTTPKCFEEEFFKLMNNSVLEKRWKIFKSVLNLIRVSKIG